MKDVARRAGTNQSTVSRVINGTASVSSNTRVKIFDAIKTLGYVPNRAARNLRRRDGGCVERTGLIAFVCSQNEISGSEYGDNFGSRIIFANIREAARRRQCLVVHGYDVESEGAVCLPVMEHQVDGVIGRIKEQRVVEGILSRVPLVLFNSPPASLQVSSVNMDESAAMWVVVKHLRELGHRRIGYFRPDPSNWEYPLRNQGFFAAAREFGIVVPKIFRGERVVAPGTHERVMDGFANDVVRAVRGKAITAAVCPGDVYAWSLFNRLVRLGVRVPEDLSLTGFGDRRVEVPLDNPGLTTVGYPFEEMAERAFEMLDERIMNVNTPEITVTIAGRLLARGSTGPVRKRF